MAGAQVCLLLTCPPPLHSLRLSLPLFSSAERANLLLLLQIYRADRRSRRNLWRWRCGRQAAAPTLNSFHPSAAARPAAGRWRPPRGRPRLRRRAPSAAEAEVARDLSLLSAVRALFPSGLRTALSWAAIGQRRCERANGVAEMGASFSFLIICRESPFSTKSLV